MDFADAQSRVALAGRELGSGPAVAIPRVVGQDYESAKDWLMRVLQFDDVEIRAEQVLWGVAIGLVMAEYPEAMDALRDISEEWRRDHMA